MGLVCQPLHVNRDLRRGSRVDGACIYLHASLVSGRSKQGLPDEDPLRGGTGNSLDWLGDVSSKGNVVISCGWALHAKNVGQVFFELFVGHHTTRRRWVRTIQSYYCG
jgi:hypothetical protein